ncbi:hypothetical protein D9757_011810 [Collybiopsis confluens]|uniref:Uncharacterized protein n=1 Tax=Collybiopsis confluens TaxID=2823264 RepID=A0A8H5LNW7_9AGAR|nr:hypothetical protein D9757_011810 [Collybiopsis confluens]
MEELSSISARPSSSPFGLVPPNYTFSKDSKYVQRAQSSQPKRADATSLRSNIPGGYWQILSPLLLAVLIAFMNHLIFAHLNGKEPGNHTDQFWVTVLKNMFPAAVAFLLFMNLKNCLLQVLDSYSLELVNLVTSPPSVLNTFSTLVKSSMRASIMLFALLGAITQAVALTSLFVPGTLSVVPSSSRTQTLEVPIIDFNLADMSQSVISLSGFQGALGFLLESQRWQQLIQRAALSNTAPEWDPPVGCGFACSYTFSYSAPCLTCTQLSKEDIWPSGMKNISDSRLAFGPKTYTFYNFSTYSGLGIPDTLEVIYMENFNSTLETTDVMLNGVFNPQQWSPMGARCIFENATYEAKTTFSNNTQASSTRVTERRPMNDTDTLANTDIAMAAFSITQSFLNLISGRASFNPEFLDIDTTETQVIGTVLFNMTAHPPVGNNPDSAFFDFSLSRDLAGNLSAGLEGLLGNITLAFVNERMATAFTEATVTPNSTEYQYIAWRLALIYTVVFGFSLLVIAYGLFCLRRNGTIAVFDLQHILEMTATSTRLHEAADHLEFESILVKGVLFSESEVGTQRRRRRIVLDVFD